MVDKVKGEAPISAEEFDARRREYVARWRKRNKRIGEPVNSGVSLEEFLESLPEVAISIQPSGYMKSARIKE